MKLIKVLAFFVIIISILIFLGSCLMLYIAGFVRECDRIKITDDNREKIVSLINEELYKEMPNFNKAKEIERYAKFRDVEITVYYEDGTRYFFFLQKNDDSPLSLLIQNEGYNVYFRSREFVADLIKLIIPLMLVALLVFLLRE